MEKEKYLDGLRGLAAFIVVIFHYLLAFYPALWTGSFSDIKTNRGIEVFIASTPLNIIYDGSLSVCIFFILSGYVLTYKLFKYGDTESIISGSIRRYIRLMIPVLFSIVVAFTFLKLGLYRNLEIAKLTTSQWFESYYNFEPNFIDAFKQGIYGTFIKGESYYNPVLWTMYYEFCGSFLVFSIAYILNKVKNRSSIYVIIVIIFMQTTFFPFIIGMIICDFYNNQNKINNNVVKFILSIIGLFLASYPPNVQVENTIYSFMKINSLTDPVYFYHSLGSALIMIVFLNSYKLKRIFSNKIFEFLGKISFSMYLIHFPILASLSSYLFLILNGKIRYFEVFGITIIISLCLILVVSYYMYKYIDLAGVRISKYMYKKYFENN